MRKMPGKRTMDIAMMRAYTAGHDVTCHIIYTVNRIMFCNQPFSLQGLVKLADYETPVIIFVAIVSNISILTGK